VSVERHLTILLNKPAGVVTTVSDPHGRRTVIDLVESDVRLFPVGRLDRDTTGALLLTNDGDLAHLLMHPRHGVEKTYLVDVEGDPGDAALEALRTGIELEDGVTAPAAAQRLGPGRIELRIHEGRNRQVRRMCEAVGHPVRRLHRSRYAGLSVEGLAPGGWRPVADEELAALRSA
jgi:pseudouridine synthase